MPDPATWVGEICSGAGCTEVAPEVVLVLMALQQLADELNKGDKAFGKNGEIIKALNTILNDAKNGLGPNNDIVRALNTVFADIKNGPGPNNDVVKLIKKIFPNL